MVADLDAGAANRPPPNSGLGLGCDVSDPAAIREDGRRPPSGDYGRVDLLLSNAGFGVQALDLDDALSGSDAGGRRIWDVHVMAHVHASRAVLPGMLAPGRSHLESVASAAGC